MNRKFYSLSYQQKKFNNDNNIEEIRIRKILSFIGSNKKVLDLGCGNGTISLKIIANNNQVTGVEFAKEAVRQVRNKGIRIYDLSLNTQWSKKIKGKFDVVFAGEVIEHIFDTDNFLQNVKGVLKKNGYLVLTTPNIASLGRRLLLLLGKNPLIETTARKGDAGHVRYFTRKTLINLLKENGFKTEALTATLVNFSQSGAIYSETLASWFPTLGSQLIVKAKPVTGL